MNNTKDKVIYHKFWINNKGHKWDFKITKHKPTFKEILVLLAWIIGIYIVLHFIFKII